MSLVDRLAGSDGLVLGAACDHRDALANQLRAQGIELGPGEIGDLKARIARAVAPLSTVLLTDAQAGYPAIRRLGGVPDGTALALALEADGYGDVARVETTTLAEDVSPAQAAALGAVACKLLLPFRVDRPEQADRQEGVAAAARTACEDAGVVLMLEPIVYPIAGEPLGTAEREDLVVAGAERLAGIGDALLKLQYPGSRSGCRRLTEALGPIPWVLLGGGAPSDELERQVAEACAAGARGFVVGRSLWSDAVMQDPAGQERALADGAVPRLERLIAAARG